MVGTHKHSEFQTDPCGVEAGFGSLTGGQSAGFRRTLVGLKHHDRDDGDADDGFQTDPCGVEAVTDIVTQHHAEKFQTDPLWG